MVRDQELETFKTQIDLREYAAECGYVWDRQESWRGSAVMRKDGDKIIIKRDGDGHYVYFSVKSDRDSGSIIDFVQVRKRLTLGEVRKELRPWLGRSGGASPTPFPRLEPTARNRVAVEAEYRRMQDADRHPYLEEKRLIPADVLMSPRFAGRVRMDRRGNAVFPHFDEEGLCGYELKNTGYTGFSKGGAKGLWFSRTGADDRRLVIAESAIDALSYAALFPDELTRYASIGGQLNPRQPELIRAAAARLPRGAEVVAAMDADDAGVALSAMVEEAVRLTGREDLASIVHTPLEGKDWNDVLKARQTSSLPTARPDPFPGVC